MTRQCPKCNSTNTKIINYMNIECLICNDCGYDERDIYEQFTEARSSQKAKGGFSPYKSGGHGRVKYRKI